MIKVTDNKNKNKLGLPRTTFWFAKSGAGFTLAELLVVIAILGILTIVVMVNFDSGKQANNLRQAGTELLQDLRLAQNYTIGGSSLNYCNGDTQDDYGDPCDDDSNCDSIECKNGVPLGGYGVNIASTENYTVFADTNNNQKLDGPNRVIVFKDLSLKGIHISRFKLGDEPSVSPSTTNNLDILFEPPVGTIHFYLSWAEAKDTGGQLINSLALLVQSDYVSNSCRKITINRISGQISESQSECSL